MDEKLKLTPRGYMIMPNKILEALITHNFSKRQMKMLLLILRMSLGCQILAMRYEHRYFQICGLYRNRIPSEIKKLERLKVIRIDREKKLIAFNFLFSEWDMVQIGNLDSEKVSKLIRRVVSKQIDEQSVLMTCSLHSDNELADDFDLKYILKIFNKNNIKRYDQERKIKEARRNLFRML